MPAEVIVAFKFVAGPTKKQQGVVVSMVQRVKNALSPSAQRSFTVPHREVAIVTEGVLETISRQADIIQSTSETFLVIVVTAKAGWARAKKQRASQKTFFINPPYGVLVTVGVGVSVSVGVGLKVGVGVMVSVGVGVVVIVGVDVAVGVGKSVV